MKKKLNLVLRDPVRINRTTDEGAPPELPSPFNRNQTNDLADGQVEVEREIENITPPQLMPPGTSKPATAKGETAIEESRKFIPKAKPRPAKTHEINKTNGAIRAALSPRIQQIWDYFGKVAVSNQNTDGTFSVTRAEVMREAGIGSTNTYRDALQKFQNLGLIEIELRPGVGSGSIFRLTETGWEETTAE